MPDHMGVRARNGTMAEEEKVGAICSHRLYTANTGDWGWESVNLGTSVSPKRGPDQTRGPVSPTGPRGHTGSVWYGTGLRPMGIETCNSRSSFGVEPIDLISPHP
jgi:hypothetical protein